MQHPTSSSDANYTTVPLGVQQFYQLAQQHAAVNSAYPTATPNYLPLPEPEAYVPAMHFGAYNMPQHMVPSAAMEVPTYEAAGSAWSQLGFGEPAASALPSNLIVAPSDSWESKPFMYGHTMTTPMAMVKREEDLPTTLGGSVSEMPNPTPGHPNAAAFSIASPSSSSSIVATSVSSQQGPNQPHEIVSDAPVTDEHKWRKYGQKQVKRSPYPRNYYKCTVSGCPAKKHLEKFWDASTNRERCRTEYLGEHVHPLAVSPQVFASNQQDFQSNVLAQSAKIRASGSSTSSANGLSSCAPIVLTPDTTAAAHHHYQQQQQQQTPNQQRLVVECSTQVDENEDGYIWRKYGQKSVKGSSIPRQYYRCRILNCPVKKTVEAAPSGNTIVTYDGCHTHEPGMHSDSHPNSPSSIVNGTATSTTNTPAPVALPPLRICIKREAPSARAAASAYPSSPSSSFSSDAYAHPVESPSSSFSTTDEDEYLSEPSPKRIFAPDSSYYAAEQQMHHHYLPDVGSVDAWFAAWD